MSASKLICYFSSHPAAFGFQASTPPDNITLNSDFQTSVGATAHATLDMEQLISHFRVNLLDTLSSLPDAVGGVIPVSEVCELLPKVHEILDNAVSKQVGNMASISKYLFNSVSRQHCEVWASQFPFLHSLRDVIPPSEACLYDQINWSMAQAHHQSSLGLSQSFHPKRGGKARPWNESNFTVQKRPMSGYVPGPSGTSLAKKPHFGCGNEAHPSGKKSAGGSVSASSAETRRKGAMGLALLMCQSPQLLQPPHHLHLQLFRLACFSNFLIHGEALHPIGMCLIWFRVTIFSLGLILPCSITSSNLMVRWLHLIIPLFRRLMSFLLRE